MEEKKGIKINFMSILAVLTFIVMGIGSTFAFFTASMAGKADEYISMSSLEVILKLGVLPLYTGKPLMPTNDEDIEKAYKNKCLDYIGNGACIAYTVELNNMGYEQEGVVIFNATSDSITNLKYMIVSEGEDYEILKGPTPAMNATGDEQLEGVPIKLNSEDNKKVVIVVWLSNINGPQDEEQGALFEGQVSFTATSGAKITGTMSENIRIQKD